MAGFFYTVPNPCPPPLSSLPVLISAHHSYHLAPPNSGQLHLFHPVRAKQEEGVEFQLVLVIDHGHSLNPLHRAQGFSYILGGPKDNPFHRSPPPSASFSPF